MAKKLTSKKARKILHDKSVHGKPLTEKQRKFFGAIAGGAEPYKAQIGTMLTALPSNMMDRLSDALAFPQRAITKLFTGEYQTPSEAIGIKNKAGAIATDILLDPVNLLGAGLAGKASKATKATKAASSAGKKSVVYTSDLLTDPRAEKAMTEGYISSKRNIDRFSKTREALRDNEAWRFSPEDLKRYKAQQALEEDMRLYHGIHPEPVINLQKLNPESVLFDMRKSHVKEFKNVPGGSEWKSSASPYVSKSEMAKFKTYEDFLKSKAKEKYKELVREYPKDYKISPLEFMNLPKNENGGWLDKYEQGGLVLKQKKQDNYGTKPNANNSDVSLPPGFVGLGYNTKGRNYSPAWGGQFAMGGNLPGATGMMYARTINPAPSNGPYAKKTKASAQNGQEMKYYQEGLDFRPKTISQDGLKLIPRATGDLRGPKIDPRMSANIAATQQRDKQEKANTTYEALRSNPALKLYDDKELKQLAKDPSKWPKHVSDAVKYENVTKTLIENNPNYNPELSLEEQRDLASDNSLKTRMLRGKNLLRNYDYSNDVPVLGTAMNIARDIMTAPGAVASNVMFPQQRYVEPFTRGSLQGVAEGATNVLSDVIDVADVGAPAALTKGVVGGLKGLGLMSKGVGLKAMTAAPLLFYKKSGTVDPINVSTFTESVNRVKELIETPAAREAFRNVGEQIASTRGLAQADPAYAAAITNPNLPMQTIDEMARVLTEVDPSKVSFTKQQRNYIKELGDVAIDVGRTTGFRDNPRSAQWLLENTQNLSARDVVPFLYGLNIPENQKIQMLNTLYDTRRGSTVANPIAEYTAARDLFSLAENYRDIPEALRLRGVLGEPRFGSNFLGNQLRRSVVDMAVKAKDARQQFELSDAYSMYRGNISGANDIFPTLFRRPYSSLPTEAQRAAAKDDVSRRILERRSEVFGDPSNIGKTFIGSGSMSADSYEMAMRAVPMAERLNATPVPMSNDIGSIFPSYANESAGIVQANDVRQQYLDRVQQTLGKRNLSTLNQDDLNLVLAYRDPINPRLLKNLMIESKMANSAISDVNRAIGSNIPAARLNDVSGIQRPLIGLIPQGGGAPREMRLTTRPTTSNITSFEQEDVQPLSMEQIRRYVNRMRPGMQLQDGGNVDPMGYWNPENWGNPVIIPSTDITMEGVYEPLIGISDTGDVQYMEPGEDYEFDGEYVTEYPVAQKGDKIYSSKDIKAKPKHPYSEDDPRSRGLFNRYVSKKVKELPVETIKTEQPKPVLTDYFQGSSVFAPTPYGGGAAFVGYKTPQGDTVFVKPEDYERMGVPEYGKKFIESKKKQRNGGVNNADAQPIEKLDQSLNFTNYNKPTKGGWLDKYQ